MENKELYSFVEERLSEPLTKKEKKKLEKWKKKSAEYDIQKANQNVVATKWSTQKNSIFRYGTTAVASVVLCLAITLPIAFGNIKTILVPEYIYVDKEPTAPNTYADGEEIKTEYAEIKSKGVLLFNGEEGASGEQAFGGEYNIIPTADGLTELSYTLKDSWLAFNEQSAGEYDFTDAFDMDYRIRLKPEYEFAGYYADRFATLVDIYKKNATLISSNDISFIFNNVVRVDRETTTAEHTDKMDITAFMVEDTVVVCTIKSNMAFIYFVYGEGDNQFEYFIKLTISDIVGTSKQLDADYIKTEIMRELLLNA